MALRALGTARRPVCAIHFTLAVANDLAALGIATLRYQFPLVDKQAKRPYSPALSQATVRAAVSAARQLAPTVTSGGKSFGRRMISQTSASRSS